MILNLLTLKYHRFYRDAAGVLLVYDTTYRPSFKHLEKRLQKVREMANPKVAMIVVGNKIDREYARSIPTTEGKAFSRASFTNLLYAPFKFLSSRTAHIFH